VRLVVGEPDQLGDCPTWDESTQRLFWIDIIGKRLSSCGPNGSALERQTLNEIPGSFALRERGGMLLGFRRRLVLLDPAGAEIASWVPDAADMTRERFNDGACDARGRFWIGTMDRHLREPVGALYRIDPDLSAHRMDLGFGISNGLAWSPRFDRLYQCDSSPPRIYVHDFDLDAGLTSNRRLFAEFSDGMGTPDGCAVDVDGFLWVAAPGAGSILGFDPQGRLARTIATPVAWPSSVVFGGSDMRTLFVTSLKPQERSTVHASRRGVPPAELGGTSAPADGSVFAMECSIPGMPRGRFGG
jgi:sugar lactone lactonase YvrE